jgi:glutamyl-tRNA reductase
MRTGVIGINHKLADLKLREKLAKAAMKRFTFGSEVPTAHPCLVLSTCNRTEIYFSSEDLSTTHSYILSILREEVAEEFDQKLYSFFGYDCFTHLCRVTAGLDSAIVAETEIQGQVKIAYENAASTLALSKDMHYLFQKAMKIAKQVRTELPIGRGIPDLEHAVMSTGKDIFTAPEEKQILFVGASAINLKIMAYLHAKKHQNITLCNRTALDDGKHARHLLPWDSLSEWHRYDWIIFGTKAPHHLIKKEHLPHECVGKKLIIDLSVPRNVDPRLAKDERVTLLNIDQLNRHLRIRREQLTSSLDKAEGLIIAHVCRHIGILQQKADRAFAVGA